MGIFFKSKRKNKWPIWIDTSNEIISVMVDPIDRVSFEIMDQLSRDCHAIGISQYVNFRNWDFEKAKEFVDKLKSDPKIEVHKGKDFNDFSEPDESSSIFTMNYFGKVDSWETIRHVIYGGTASMSTIFYGVRQPLVNWQNEMLEWNKLVYKWVKLELQDKEPIMELINKLGFIAEIIDGDYYFSFTKVKTLNYFLETLWKTSVQKNYSIDLRINPYKRKDF